jgi:Raf kinase inhibitor-like YbhB/YbcL family protein
MSVSGSPRLSAFISLVIYLVTRSGRPNRVRSVNPGTPGAVVVGAVLVSCTTGEAGSTGNTEVTTMELTSGSFGDGEAIPPKHTCDGADVSPPLAWDNVPDGTASFALIVDDPDARGFVHWVLADIPGATRELAEGEGDSIGTPGPNDFGRTGWGGPCPPGKHRYAFTLYALPGSTTDATDADAVRTAAEASALAKATLTGVYSRR